VLEKLRQTDMDRIEAAIKNLAIKKTWKINVNGSKVKVVRKTENEYATYLNGNYITTDEAWKQAFDLSIALLIQNR
jgi:hypothetical protein